MRRFADEYKEEMNIIAPTPEQCERIRLGVHKKMARPSARRVLIPATAFTGVCAAVFCGVIFISNFFGATSAAPKDNAAAVSQVYSDYVPPVVNSTYGLSREPSAPGAGADIAVSNPEADKPMSEGTIGNTAVDEAEDAGFDAKNTITAGANDDYYIGNDAVTNEGENCEETKDFIKNEVLYFSNNGNSLEYNGKSYVITDKPAPNADSESMESICDDSGNRFFIFIDSADLAVYDSDGRFIAVYHVN